MIAFIVDGEELDLMPNFTVPIEWESGLFSDQFVLNGISTLPLALPFTDKNKRLLRYFHLVENSLKNLQVDCQLHLANNLWCTGQLTVAIKGETFDTDFSEITPLALAADKKLSEILKDDVTDIIPPFQRWWSILVTYFASSGNIHFKFTVNNEELDFFLIVTFDFPADMDNIFNQVSTNAIMDDLFIMERVVTGGSLEEEIKFTLKDTSSPDANLNINIELLDGALFQSFPFGPVPDWPNYQAGEIKNKLTADVNKLYPNANFCCPTIRNLKFYGTNNPGFSLPINCLNYYNQEYLRNAPALQFAYSISPQLYLGYVLQRLGHTLNFTFNGTFTTIAELFNRLFVYSNRAIDLIGSDFKNPSSPQNIYNFWQARVITGDHVPDATLRDFFTSISKYFALGLFYRNNILSLHTKESLLKSTNILDLTDVQFRIYDELKGTFSNGFFLKYAPDGGDEFLSENVKPIDGNYVGQYDTFDALPKRNIKGGEFASTKNEKKLYRARIQRISNKLTLVWDYIGRYLHGYFYKDLEYVEIDTLASGTLNEFADETGFRRILAPRIDQDGAGYEFYLSNKAAPIRFMLYWGLQNARASVGAGGEDEVFVPSTNPALNYPYASMDNKSISGAQLGPYKLLFEDSDGIFENFHKNWLDFLLRTKKLTIQTLLTPSQLLQVDLSQKVQLGPNQFFIEKIAADINATDKLVPCKFDLYKI